MRVIKALLILIVITAACAAAVLYFGRHYAARRAVSMAIERLEASSGRHITVDRVMLASFRGISFRGIHIGPSSPAAADGADISSATVAFDFPRLLSSKEFFIDLGFSGFKADGLTAGGRMTILSGKCRKTGNLLDAFKVCSLELIGVNITYGGIEVKNVSGKIAVNNGDGVSAPSVGLRVNGVPYILSCRVNKIKTEPELMLSVTGQDMRADVKAYRRGESAVIDEIDIVYLNSRLTARAEVKNFSEPVFSASGKADWEMSDLGRAIPKLKDSFPIKGHVSAKFKASGRPTDLSSVEASAVSSSSDLKAGTFSLPDVIFDVEMKNGMLKVPLIASSPYNGNLAVNFSMNVIDPGFPFNAHATLKNISINRLVQDTSLKNKDLYGTLNSEFSVKGNAADRDSFVGAGFIKISEGNLGPMPILSPLLGNVYGVMRNMLPGLRQVDIQGGYCDFTVKNRLVATDNLVLSGDVLNIYAVGYIDFDKNLNFEVRNEFKETQQGTDDISTGIIQFISGFGKMIGKAYLTGTLPKPKWKFEYLNGIEDSIGNKISGALKDIFQ